MTAVTYDTRRARANGWWGVVVFVLNALKSLKTGALSGANPWDAPNLEWATSSPPPHYNFAVIPTVTSPYPNWDRADRDEDARRLEEGELVLDGAHETPTSTVNDAAFTYVAEMPPESPWPIAIAAVVSIAFALLLTTHYVAAGVFVGLAALGAAAWNTNEPELA